MAKLTESQIKFMLNRQLKDEIQTKRKVETHKKKEKETYDEEWHRQQQKIKENEIGQYLGKKTVEVVDSEKTVRGVNEEDKKEVMVEVEIGYEPPTVYDSFDLADFVKPIDVYRDRYGEDYNIYFDRYRRVTEDYQKVLDEINKKLYPNQIEESLEESSENSADFNEKMRVLDKVKRDYFEDAFEHFQEYIPIYNKYVCTCCGGQFDVEEFYINFDRGDMSKIDAYGNVRTHICKRCCEKLFNFYLTEKADKDAEKAMKMFCASLNIYWDYELFKEALKAINVSANLNHITYEYIKIINENKKSMGKTFMDSPFLDEKYITDKLLGIAGPGDIISGLSENQQKMLSIDDINDTDIITWDKQDLKNRRQVIKMVGYDPFDYETPENRKQLYNDLIDTIEPGMEQDNIKVQAAIQIVISYLKIREMNKQYRDMQEQGASLTELKSLAELKSKELKAITDFSKDNGFSERYSIGKAKGENTFTGILARMSEDKFENAIANKYDIATSASIQQVADASIAAIFKQLSYSDSDAFKTVSDQYKELIKLRKDLDETKEQLRLTKVELKRRELEDIARKKGIDLDDDDDDEIYLEDYK